MCDRFQISPLLPASEILGVHLLTHTLFDKHNLYKHREPQIWLKFSTTLAPPSDRLLYAFVCFFYFIIEIIDISGKFKSVYSNISFQFKHHLNQIWEFQYIIWFVGVNTVDRK